MSEIRRCQGITVRGKPCRNKVKKGAVYCRHHQPDKDEVGVLEQTKKDKEALLDELLNLARQVPEETKKALVSGELVKERLLYAQPQVEEFEFKAGSILRSRVLSHHIEEEEWNTLSQHNLAQKLIRRAGKECIAGIEAVYEMNEGEANFKLSTFVRELVGEVIEQDTTPESYLHDRVTMFIRDLDEEPVNWKVAVWLKGIWPSQKRLELEDGVVLRQPIPADLEERMSAYLLLAPGLGGTDFPHDFSSVLELDVLATQPNEVQTEVSRFIKVLRLLRLGSVISPKFHLSPNSLLQHSGTLGSVGGRKAVYKYALNPDDVVDYKSFAAKIIPLLPELEGDTTPLGIAFRRYETALFDHLVESRITLAVTCLEALYLKANEMMELSHKLSQRVAALMGLISFGESLEVYRTVKRAYGIRSKFVHGVVLQSGRRQDASQLCEAVLDFARASLSIALQLNIAGSEKDKGAYIDKIDNSLLDDESRDHLKRLIEPVVVTR